MQKITFIGHRNVMDYKNLKTKLYNEIKKQIENGSKFFTLGTHGEFDKLALSVLREFDRNLHRY